MILNWQSDAYLSKAGFFSALSPKHQILAGPKKLRLADNLTVKLVLSDYGPPTAQDFTYYLAYLKLLTYRAAGSDDLATLLQRPQPVTNYQLLRLLGQTQGHNNYQSLEDWRLRLRFTGLALHQTDSKARQELTPLRDSYAVSAPSRQAPHAAGEAEKHTLLFAPWLQEALARAPLLLVAEGAWARYRTLTSPLAQLLVPQLDRWFYATRQDHTFVKNYQNLAHLLGLPVHPSRIRIQRQLHFGLGQLVAAGYLRDWKLERARHYETVYNVVLQGPAQGASVAVPHMPPAADTEASFRASETRQDAPHPAPADLTLSGAANRPRTPANALPAPAPSPASRHLTEQHVADLVAAGLPEVQARTLLASLPATQPVGSQIAYWLWDFTLRPGRYSHKAGFLRTALQENWPLPAAPHPSGASHFSQAPPEPPPTAAEAAAEAAEQTRQQLLLSFAVYQERTTQAAFLQLPAAEQAARCAAPLAQLDPTRYSHQADWVKEWQMTLALKHLGESLPWPSFADWAAPHNPPANDLLQQFPLELYGPVPPQQR